MKANPSLSPSPHILDAKLPIIIEMKSNIRKYGIYKKEITGSPTWK